MQAQTYGCVGLRPCMAVGVWGAGYRPMAVWACGHVWLLGCGVQGTECRVWV